MATSDAAEAVLGPATTVRGQIRGEGDLRIFGTLEGEVDVRGTLTVAVGGAVRGETLAASEVVVAGEVVADVRAEGDITIMAGATVRGRLRGRSVRVHEGARLSADLDADFDLPAELLTLPPRPWPTPSSRKASPSKASSPPTKTSRSPAPCGVASARKSPSASPPPR